MMLEPLRAFLHQIGDFLPRLLLALVILIVGWLLAKAVRFAIVKALRAINFHVLTERAGIDGFLQQGGGDADTTQRPRRARLLAGDPGGADDRVQQPGPRPTSPT